MATFHFTAKAGSKGKGASASIHADYILRQGKYSIRTDLENTGHGNLPIWCNDNPVEFWRSADLYERKNGVVYREHELALPIEATPMERKAIIEEWCQTQYRNHAYLYAIHDKAGNPHCHIMICDRRQDGIERSSEQFFKREATSFRHIKTKELIKVDPSNGGCPKSIKWCGPNRNKHIEKMRESWADIQNIFYKNKGIANSVDHRTLEVQRREAIEESEFESLAIGHTTPEFEYYKQKAAILNREPDRRVNHRRYRTMQRSGQLKELNEYRAANRELAAAKADLQVARDQRRIETRKRQERITKLYAQRRELSKKIKFARTVIFGRDFRDRIPIWRELRAVKRVIKRVNILLLDSEARSLMAQIEAEKLAIDSARAKATMTSSANLSGHAVSSRDITSDESPEGQQQSESATSLDPPETNAGLIYGPNATFAALWAMAKNITNPEVQAKFYKLAAIVEKLPSGTVIYEGSTKLRPVDLYNNAVTAVNTQRQRDRNANLSAQAVKVVEPITGTPSQVVKQYRAYIQLINDNDPTKARTLMAICNSELANVPSNREITLPAASADLTEIRAALKQQGITGGRKR